ncbi:hypothetical protein PGT21_026068 [Puccinia graminis f. sp. tritici]|uniref:Uncharacterized protein n=1 Tax=Puccinia graminis f. sp. tritici TaxID=56615 RepID=A0A5B0MLK1_PUCGR|nr:hypothetical protein PGT21_026068 [Puccinia graminis f. sp. tritici]
MTSREHLRVSQFPFRAEKARLPCENLDFLGLNRKLRGSQIRREVLHSEDGHMCIHRTADAQYSGHKLRRPEIAPIAPSH